MLNLILLIILTPLLIFFIIFWIIQLRLNSHKYRIGFLPTLSSKLNTKLRGIIQKYTPDTKNYNFIELGAGVANITRNMALSFKFKKVIAVEVEQITMFFAKLIQRFSQAKVEYITSDIFDYKMPSKSIYYCFLGGSIVDKLYQEGKFENSLVISATFPLSDIKPTEIIPLHNFYKKLYIYDFRK